MPKGTNNQPPPFGGLTPKQLKTIVERCVTHLLVVMLDCLTPVRSNLYRRDRARWELEQCVNKLDEALRKMRG